ncbi:aspartate aminotransferase, aminotransferase, classes I and II [Campylobacter avium LMG 24591]|uniref:Aspartate aminotransferase, aminotransferase, classes I and II n=1 Tax=Campylobacter avium LMG 24591 TaxID=522484 RepID=A0A222MYN2_9BACT|nr:pyridoxal phosphate-dependent aminotransferase [Campylobacter avium]ASQ30706.1 aspartate aminotransferase, aminotransferase, classes I and II [Campylobacter avium LMG 24591]OYD79803.1 aspartate aminotransferase, aminotransferase, classes I and II [Campylobacter avium]
MLLSKRSQVLEESLTIAITTIAKNLKAQGEDILSFSAGEPDFDTPKKVKEAAIKAIEQGCAAYTNVEGNLDVLQAIQTKFKRDNDLDYDTSEIITNVGAKQSLFNCIQCLLEEGDEAIIPAPCWVSYPEMVKFAGAKPVLVQTKEENSFKLKADELKKAITSKSKMLILNYPSNPVGAVYSKDELKELAAVLEGSDIVVLSDEMYEKLQYDNEDFFSFAKASDDALKRTVTINGLSKCAAMPGWRFGYMACKDKELIKALKKLQSQSTSNICSIVQKAAIPVLLGEVDEDIEMMRNEFEKRRNKAYEMINSIEGLKISNTPKGAFYLFINIQDVEKDSMLFCKRLLEEQKVALVPGLGFGMDGFVRFSYATSMDNIVKGIQRIQEFVKNYKA